MTILELFASLLPRRMQILSPGEGLEGHFQEPRAGERAGGRYKINKLFTKGRWGA